MKKLISLLLCALMVSSLSLAAFAVPAPGNGVGEVLSPCATCSHTQNGTGVLYSATCNGTTQTWYFRCANCHRTYTVHYTCPAGPHISSHCEFLPI